MLYSANRAPANKIAAKYKEHDNGLVAQMRMSSRIESLGAS